MNRTHNVMGYTDPTTGAAVIVQRYDLDPKEVEISSLRQQIRAEGWPEVEAGVYAVAALPMPQREFIEWITGGILSINEAGELTGDESTVRWLKQIGKIGVVW